VDIRIYVEHVINYEYIARSRHTKINESWIQTHVRQDITWAAFDNFTKPHTLRIIDFATMWFRIMNQPISQINVLYVRTSDFKLTT
jgi:hypothetical protein